MAKKKPNVNNLRQGQTIHRSMVVPLPNGDVAAAVLTVMIQPRTAIDFRNFLKNKGMCWNDTSWHATHVRAKKAADAMANKARRLLHANP